MKEKYIAQFSLLESLSREIINSFEMFSYEKGEYLYHQGEDAHTFYLLLEGKLQVDYLKSNGSQTVLSFVEPLFTIGDLELFEDWPTIRNVEVLERSILFAAPINVIRDYGYDDPRFLRFILHYVIKKLDLSSTLLVQAPLNLECRLAGYLLHRMGKSRTVLHLEKREALAAILGTSVRHLNRTLKRLSDLNVIEVHNKTLKINDPLKLSAIAEDTHKKGT